MSPDDGYLYWLIDRERFMSEIRNKNIHSMIHHLILTKQSFPDLEGQANVQVRVARGVATVAVGTHHRGPVLAVSVCPDWVENVGEVGIGSVGGGLTLAATPAAANICPEGAERTWMVQWAEVKRLVSSAGRSVAGPTFLAVARLGYVCEYGGLCAFGVDPNLALKVCVDTYYKAIQGIPNESVPSMAMPRGLSGATLAMTAATAMIYNGDPSMIYASTGGCLPSNDEIKEAWDKLRKAKRRTRHDAQRENGADQAEVD